MTWREFCDAKEGFKDMLMGLLDTSEEAQVQLLEVENMCSSSQGRKKRRALGNRRAQDDIKSISVKVSPATKYIKLYINFA